MPCRVRENSGGANLQLAATATLVKTADQNQQVALGRYQAGVGTILDLLTAQTAAASAAQARINAELAWETARGQLALALGHLSRAQSPWCPNPPCRRSEGGDAPKTIYLGALKCVPSLKVMVCVSNVYFSLSKSVFQRFTWGSINRSMGSPASWSIAVSIAEILRSYDRLTSMTGFLLIVLLILLL